MTSYLAVTLVTMATMLRDKNHAMTVFGTIMSFAPTLI
jgi:hypothetical protein